MSVPRVEVIIIRGAPGVGKTEVAKCLARHFPGGAKVEVDVLRKMIISVHWTDQREHTELLQVAARVVGDFLGLGFSPVIVVDTFSGDKVDSFLKTLQQLNSSPSVRLFGLHASETALRQRLDRRPEGQFKDFEVSAKLNTDILHIRRPEETQIDASDLCAKELAQIIVSKLA
jgi:hypothetical protein